MVEPASCRNPYCDREAKKGGWCHPCYQLYRVNGGLNGSKDIPNIAGMGGFNKGYANHDSVKNVNFADALHCAVNVRMTKEEFQWRNKISDQGMAQFELDHDFSFSLSSQAGIPIHLMSLSQSEVFLRGFKFPEITVVPGKPNKYRVKLTKAQEKELHPLISPGSIKYLSPQEYLLYWLMVRQWGSLKRNAVFSVLGLDPGTADDRMNIKLKLAKQLGNLISEMAVAIEFYLATWRGHMPLNEDARESHLVLSNIVPAMYKVSAMLMSESLLLKDKRFKDAITVVHISSTAGTTVYNALAQKTNMEERRDWMTQVYMLGVRSKMAVRGVLGTDATTTLNIR